MVNRAMLIIYYSDRGRSFDVILFGIAENRELFFYVICAVVSLYRRRSDFITGQNVSLSIDS